MCDLHQLNLEGGTDEKEDEEGVDEFMTDYEFRHRRPWPRESLAQTSGKLRVGTGGADWGSATKGLEGVSYGIYEGSRTTQDPEPLRIPNH